MNQTFSSRRADCHKAKPFQTKDQMAKIIKKIIILSEISDWTIKDEELVAINVELYHRPVQYF